MNRPGVLHAHVTVLNHDELTGLALRGFPVHWQFKRANDELAREMGMRVIEPQQRQPLDAWATRRAELPEFDQQLGDAVAEARAAALAHSQPSMAVFVAKTNARGVEVVEHDHVVKSGSRAGHAEGDTATGITYRMRDETTPKRRMRRRKASALSSEFTHDALAADLKPQPQPAPAPAPQQAALLFSSGLAGLRRQRDEEEQEAQPVERVAATESPPEGVKMPEVSAAAPKATKAASRPPEAEQDAAEPKRINARNLRLGSPLVTPEQRALELHTRSCSSSGTGSPVRKNSTGTGSR